MANSVAYGFRDDITDEELGDLIDGGVVFECAEHGVYEEVAGGTLDEALRLLRKENSDG